MIGKPVGRVLATALALTLAPLAGAASAADLTVARPTSPATMDPGFLREPGTIVDNIFDTLVRRDAEMKLVPGLAESWRALDDTTWEFKLRPGIKFHNGEALTAEAVKFTLDRVLDPKASSPTISYIRTIKSVTVVDPLTVRIETDGPDPLIPTRMSRYPAYIVPPGYVSSVGAAEFGRKPVGTGPYKLTEFVPDRQVVLVADPAYWRGKPSIDRVIFRPIPDDTARLTALITGEVQMIENVPADLAPMLQASPEVDLVQVKNGGLTIYLGLKTAEAPLDNPKVRQALSHAIDRKTIVEAILRNLATATGTQVGPADFGYLAVAPAAYDPARAKALLAEAGFPNGFPIRMQGVRRYMKSADVSQAIADQFKAIGVQVTLEVPEWSVYTQQVPAGRQAPVYMLGWGSTQTLDADAAIYAIFRSGEPYSQAKLAELDRLLDLSRRTVDAAKREQILHDVQKLAAAEVPVLTLYQEDALYGKRKNVDFTGRRDARISAFDIRLK